MSVILKVVESDKETRVKPHTIFAGFILLKSVELDKRN